MKSARNTLPTEPVNGVTCGIDWARDDHAVSVVDHHGRESCASTVDHDAAGLRELLTVLDRAGAREVAIERPDGPVVDTLLGAGITVVVISPNQLKNLRSRYGSAGNKDDRFDAFVLADTLRTDRARLHPLLPDTPATVALRQTCRARKDLVAHRVAVANQLRAHLKIVFPGAVGLFADLDSPISLAFLTRFNCQDRADWLSVTRLAYWLAGVGYSGRTDPASSTAVSPVRTARHHRDRRHRHHPRLCGRTGQPRSPDQGPRCRHRRPTQPTTQTPTSSRPCRARAPSAPHACSPRSATAAPDSPPPSRWPAWLALPPPHDNPAKSNTSDSVGPPTNNSATPSPTSPATADTTTPGPPTSTTAPEPADTTTPTPYASSPAPGSTSSGTAGKTDAAYDPANHRALQTLLNRAQPGRLDTGQLMRSLASQLPLMSRNTTAYLSIMVAPLTRCAASLRHRRDGLGGGRGLWSQMLYTIGSSSGRLTRSHR